MTTGIEQDQNAEAIQEIQSLFAENELPKTEVDEDAVRDGLAALNVPGLDAATVQIEALVPLPTATNPEFGETGYSEFEQRLQLHLLPDEEKLRVASAAADRHPHYVNEYADILRDRAIEHERAYLSFPKDDGEQIARDLGVLEQYVKRMAPHVNTLMSNPEGEKKIHAWWSDSMVSRLVGEQDQIYHAMRIGVLAGNEAVAFADWERGLDDTYGGSLTAANNLLGDLFSSAGRTAASMALGNVQLAADANNITTADTVGGLQALLDHPLLAEDMRAGFEESLGDYHGYGVTPPDWQTASDDVTKTRDDANLYFYRGRSEGPIMGSLQHIAEGLGSTIPSLAAWLSNPALGLASSWGAGYSEVSDAMPDASINERFAYGSFGAALYTALDLFAVDAYVKGWNATSPGGKWARESIFKPFVGEAVNEGGQALVSEIGTEINASLSPGYEFSASRFIARAAPSVVTEGFWGGLTGGIIGAAGSNPVRVYAKDRLWRQGQKVIDQGVSKLKNLDVWKKNPAKGKEIAEAVIDKIRAPRNMFMEADEVRVMFQKRPEALETFLADADVTMQDFNAALSSESEIEISTAGLIRYQSRPDADPAMQKLAKPTPDAPSVGALAEREADQAAIVDEYNRIQRTNESLPEPFAIFRQQAADASDDADYAQKTTDYLLAGARVAAGRLGITPEQFLNSRPIQVILENGLKRVRSAGEIVAQREDSLWRRQTQDAADAANQREGKREYVKAPNGGTEYGIISREMAQSDAAREAGLVPAPVVLEVGEQDESKPKGRKGYGYKHIESQIGKQLEDMGYSDVKQFVFDILQDPDAILADSRSRDLDKENLRFGIVRKTGKNELVVIELQKSRENGEDIYTVITAGVRRKLTSRYKEIWAKSSSSAIAPVSPSSQSASDGNTTGTDLTRELGAKPPVPTIPVDSSNVNQWLESALDTIIEQTGIADEDAGAFREYASRVLQQGGDSSNIDALTDDVKQALNFAEGFEQAAAGLERILAEPENPQTGVTQALLDSMGIESADIQEGVGIIRGRMEEYRQRAGEWRKFYTDPQLTAKAREQRQQLDDNRVRGNINFMPHVAALRVFNGRQDVTTIGHELFHYFFNELKLAAERAGPESQVWRDYQRLNAEVNGELESPDEQVRIDAEEKLAKLHEQYLFEGRSPSPGLLDMFRRFRTWAAGVFRSVAGVDQASINPEVRMVFNRMLASEEEMNQARIFYDDYNQLTITDAIPESKRAELREKAEHARMTSEEKHIARVVKDFMRALGGRKAFRAQAREEITQQRPYRVVRALKDMGGLSRADVESEIGEVEAERLFRNHRGVIKESPRLDRAEPADMAAIAHEFGFDTQHDMVKSVSEAPNHALPTDSGLTDVQRNALKAADRARREGGLDELYVIDNFGEAAAARMREVFGTSILHRDRGKIGALLEAERFGYDSLAAMLGDLADTPSYAEAVSRRTDQMVAAQEAEIRRIAMEDAATPADAEYHDDAYSDFWAAKQRVLDAEAAAQATRDNVRMYRMMSDRALREAAKTNTGRKAARKAGQYHIEVEAFKRHGKNAMAAELKGDFVTAGKELQLQRLAHYSIREALQARDELTDFENRNGRASRVLRRLDGENGRPKVEFKYRQAIKDILTTFKVVTSARMQPTGPVEQQVAIPGFQDNPEAESFLPALAKAIAPWIVNREGAANLKNWKDLTLDQVRQLNDAIITLEKVGQGELAAFKDARYGTIKEMIIDSIARMTPRDDRPKQFDTDRKGRNWRNWLDWFGVGALIPEYILAIADGNTGITGKGVGPLQSASNRLRRCLADKSDIVNRTMEKIDPAMRTLEGYRKRFGKIDTRTFGQLPESLVVGRDKSNWTAEMAIMILLESGNAGNLKATLKGYDIKQEQWRAILSTFTEAELQSAQIIWDAFNDMFPLIDEVTFRQVNRHVEQVAAQPLTVVSSEGTEVTLDGGYFPLIFDALADADTAKMQNIEVTMNKVHAQAIHGFARLADGFTQSRRVDEDGNPVTTRPPLLRLDVITSHVDKAAHYIALADAVSEFDRLTLDEDWSGVFVQKFGQAYYDAVRQYIKRIADPDSGNLAQNDMIRKSMEWLRHKATVAALGLRIVTGLKQRLDYAPAALHMSLHSRTGASGFKYLWYGMRQIGWKGNLGLMNEKVQAIFDKSAVMRDRDGNVTADMREMVSRTRGDKSVYNLLGIEFTASDIHNGFFKWIQMNDRAAACAVWLGAYQMALDGNGSFDSAGMTIDQIEAAAIEDADRAAATLASSTTADLTAWQADKGLPRLFTTFLSGTVRRTSRMAQYVDALRRGQITKGQFLSNLIIDAALQAWVPGLLYLSMKALTGDDDDEPSMWDWFSTLFIDPVMTVSEGVPFFNMFNSAAKYGSRGAFTPSALGELERQFLNSVSAGKKLSEGEYREAAYKAMLVGTYAAGVPVERPKNEIKKTLQAVGAMEKDK